MNLLGATGIVRAGGRPAAVGNFGRSRDQRTRSRNRTLRRDGWSRADLTSNFVPFLRTQLHLGLDHDDIVEMYYNAWLTSWLGATLDLQIVNPALKKKPSVSRGGLKDVDTALVGGIRLYVRF